MSETAISEEDKRALEHIAEICKNARASSFGLFALLAFVGVTLAGHKDSDFFAFGVETQLPLIGGSVPTVTFFFAAQLLVSALYIDCRSIC